MSEVDHANHLHIVLQTLKEQELYAKFLKCEFQLNAITVLGHVISSKGIMVDLQKVVVVKKRPRPTIPFDIWSFLNLVGYYMRFVVRFSFISSPLTK